jgi:putative ABC transport system ATP-binding protein
VIDISDMRFSWPKSRSPTLTVDRMHISQGESVFLYGPSGSGKSTLLALMVGIVTANEGSVAALETDWRTLKGGRRDTFRADHIGYVFQQFNLLAYLSARESVMLPCRFSSIRAKRAEERSGSVEQAADDLLDRIGITGQISRQKASELSVGQQQRVAAVRALIGQPEILIADEPTSALDDAVRDEFVALLLSECRSVNTTLVFVSHDQRLAARFDSSVSIDKLNSSIELSGL